MKRLMAVVPLTLLLLSLPFLATNCGLNSSGKSPPLAPSLSEFPDSNRATGRTEVQHAIAFPAWYKELPVPWMPQSPPGVLENSKNCGPTCALMIDGYLRSICYAQSAISSADYWLYQRFNDSRYLDPNGWYTGFGNRNELGALIHERFGRNYSVMNGGSYDDIGRILAYIKVGQPVICGVMIYGGNLVSSGGVVHWVVAVGWDQGTGEIILNDPGTDRGWGRGNKIHYSFSAFDASWRTQGRIFAPVS